MILLPRFNSLCTSKVDLQSPFHDYSMLDLIIKMKMLKWYSSFCNGFKEKEKKNKCFIKEGLYSMSWKSIYGIYMANIRQLITLILKQM